MELSPKSSEIINKWREGGDKRRESARNARELYENLSDSLKDKVDALSDAVTNKVLADAEARYGDTIYFGQQFNKDLMKACRDYATGYSRDSEHFTAAFLSEPRWIDTVDAVVQPPNLRQPTHQLLRDSLIDNWPHTPLEGCTPTKNAVV